MPTPPCQQQHTPLISASELARPAHLFEPVESNQAWLTGGWDFTGWDIAERDQSAHFAKEHYGES